MITLDKWLDRIYSETDFGRSVATSIAGVVGLAIYLVLSDWVISMFSAIIAFPLIRLCASGIQRQATERTQARANIEEARKIYGRLSDGEKSVVEAFVRAGGSVLTWSQASELNLPIASIESLIQREVIWTSMTADGMRETFALNSDVFDAAQTLRRI